jgi:NAD(P)-dependent dehydrogenase (short-subunit alcohol dehydrogenase family)
MSFETTKSCHSNEGEDAMDLGLQDKHAIVTGGSRGVWQAIARELARERVDVAIVARNKGDLEMAARELAAAQSQPACTHWKESPCSGAPPFPVIVWHPRMRLNAGKLLVGTADRTPLPQQSEEEASWGAGIGGLDAAWRSH